MFNFKVLNNIFFIGIYIFDNSNICLLKLNRIILVYYDINIR